MRKRTLAALALALAFAFVVAGQSLPRPSEVVKPQGYVSLEPVPRGRTFEIAVVAEIRQGFHVNANKVFEDYLISTTLDGEMPKGLRWIETIYPDGELQKFQFAEKMLNVYDGKVTLRMKLQALPDAPLGTVSLPLVLRYQACNDRACLPPVKLNVPVKIKLAEASAKAKPANAEIFKPAKKK